MKEITKEEKKIIEQKLKKIKLDINNIPDIFNIKSKLKYRARKEYDNSYKVYKFIDVENIDIYITNATRLDENEKKYKNAKPLIEYLIFDDEENMENYVQFIQMLKRLDLEKMDEIEKEQKNFEKNIPYQIKYNDNFTWDIYYSETEDRYFMMFPMEEERVECLFYLIKKKIENNNKKRKKERIYVPINDKDLSYNYLKKSEITDLENYLWFFTGDWPNIYEVYNENDEKKLEVIGTIPVYEKIKSIYKYTFNNKEESQEQFKLIKALFILQSNMEEEYNFKLGLSDEGKINFYYNHNQITYKNLSDFIKEEIKRKKIRIDAQIGNIVSEKEKWLLLKEAIEKKNAEYILKEKQIVTFLECKKTFFGRISYFFKKKKNKLVPLENETKVEKNNEKIEKYEVAEKELYTIEDLLKIGEFIQKKEKELKNLQMDIKALENKNENLERKIKNATLYINEIESHKKSIFDFWKFTNKDEVNLLVEGEKEVKQQTHTKIKRVFSYEEDIEDLGKKVDEEQRLNLNEKETDAIFAIYQDTETFNLISKNKLLKKDEKQIEKKVKELKEEYQESYEQIKEKDFDIFGSVVEDKTKIKTLKNNKHREIEKDKFRVLNINLDTDLESYEDIISNYKILLEEVKNNIKLSYDLPIYKIGNETIENEKWIIMDINPENVIKKIKSDDNEIILNRVNVKEGMPLIYYSNIMFYDNRNQTLPLGMDLSTEVLIDLQKYEMKLVSRKDFKINYLIDEANNEIKKVQVYEYDIDLKE